MVWAGVSAWVSAVIMCFTVGPDWKSRLEYLSSYLSWFMDVTGSVYGGGVFCAIIMMGLNVSGFLLLSVDSSTNISLNKVLDHCQPIHGKCPDDLENGHRACISWL